MSLLRIKNILLFQELITIKYWHTNMKIKTGIIGYGVVGKKRKKYINENENLELCAISDILFA